MLPYTADTMAGITAAIQQFLFVQLKSSRMQGPREPECSAASTATSFLAETLSLLHYWAAQKSLQGRKSNSLSFGSGKTEAAGNCLSQYKAAVSGVDEDSLQYDGFGEGGVPPRSLVPSEGQQRMAFRGKEEIRTSKLSSAMLQSGTSGSPHPKSFFP